jgi:hypothetical protein
MSSRASPRGRLLRGLIVHGSGHDGFQQAGLCLVDPGFQIAAPAMLDQAMEAAREITSRRKIRRGFLDPYEHADDIYW